MIRRRIFFRRLAVEARVGILDHEQRGTQPLHIDAEIDVLAPRRNDHDHIADVIDYRPLREALLAECTRGHVNLLETLAERMSERLLADFPAVQGGVLRVAKPTVFADCDAVGIEIQFERQP